MRLQLDIPRRTLSSFSKWTCLIIFDLLILNFALAANEGQSKTIISVDLSKVYKSISEFKPNEDYPKVNQLWASIKLNKGGSLSEVKLKMTHLKDDIWQVEFPKDDSLISYNLSIKGYEEQITANQNGEPEATPVYIGKSFGLKENLDSLTTLNVEMEPYIEMQFLFEAN